MRVKPHRLVPVMAGDVLVKHSSGGGGVDNPAERDPELVREDVENELVSIATARDTYKVVINSDTLQVDVEGTNKLRGILNEAAE